MQIIGLEAILLVFLIIITLTIIFTKDLLAAIIVYSGFSFCAMLLYIIMGAADVAFTEAVIGVISTIYFVIAIKSLDKMKSRRERKMAAEAEVDSAAGVSSGAEADAEMDAAAGLEMDAAAGLESAAGVVDCVERDAEAGLEAEAEMDAAGEDEIEFERVEIEKIVSRRGLDEEE